MSDIPPAALTIGGFALAHAAWVVSDQVELMTPFALVERAGEWDLQHFETETQEQAIAAGKASMAEWSYTTEAWAFAREGLFRPANRLGLPAEPREGDSDVVIVDCWAKGMNSPVTIIQRVQRFSLESSFKLDGEFMLSVDGQLVGGTGFQHLIDSGIRQHPKVSRLWDTWR